jgi:hypothetical protein
LSDQEQNKPSVLQVVGSVLSAFFGVQSERNRERDFGRGNPFVFIAVGVILTLVFVLLVWSVVQMVLPN